MSRSRPPKTGRSQPAGGNGQTIGGVTATGGTLQLAATDLQFKGNGYFGNGQSISAGSGATLQVTQDFNTNRHSIVLDGGTLDITSGGANDGNNYVTSLTLSNGANVTDLTVTGALRDSFTTLGILPTADYLGSWGRDTVEIIAVRPRPGAKPKPSGEDVVNERYIPERYNLESELKAEVTEAGPNQFDFSLE